MRVWKILAVATLFVAIGGGYVFANGCGGCGKQKGCGSSAAKEKSGAPGCGMQAAPKQKAGAPKSSVDAAPKGKATAPGRGARIDAEIGTERKAKAKTQTMCPIMTKKINKKIYVDHGGKRIYLCCRGCIGTFKKDPTKYIKAIEAKGIVLAKTPKKDA